MKIPCHGASRRSGRSQPSFRTRITARSSPVGLVAAHSVAAWERIVRDANADNSDPRDES